MNAQKAYIEIAKKQFEGVLAPIKTEGLVVKKEGRYMVQTDRMGFIVPININISKHYGRRVSCTFNIYNGVPVYVPMGVPVMLVSISKLPI